jgi:hypothetical protein
VAPAVPHHGFMEGLWTIAGTSGLGTENLMPQ